MQGFHGSSDGRMQKCILIEPTQRGWIPRDVWPSCTFLRARRMELESAILQWSHRPTRQFQRIFARTDMGSRQGGGVAVRLTARPKR